MALTRTATHGAGAVAGPFKIPIRRAGGIDVANLGYSLRETFIMTAKREFEEHPIAKPAAYVLPDLLYGCGDLEPTYSRELL